MILIEVNAIRRSGHHAFINWLISNIHGVKYDENLCKWKFNTIVGDTNVLWVNEGEDGTQGCIEYISSRNNIDITIISYEAPNSKTMDNPNYSILTDELREKWGVTEHIQLPLVRDYYNNFASINKVWPMFDPPNKQLYNAYHHVYKHQLNRALTTFRGVMYDKWVSDEEYANEVCLKLIGKPNKYHPLEIGGTKSSYDKGTPKLDALFNRYKTVKWPKWVLDEVMGDKMLSEAIKKAGMDKSDVKS